MSRLCSWAMIILLSTLSVPGAGAAEDFHLLFEERCGSCHGHAGEFARDTLETVDGVVRGRKSGRDIKDFLPEHFGRLSSQQIELFAAVFAKQIDSGGLFQERCAICHVRASDLVRARMILIDERLMGRYSGRDIETFLRGHGRTTEAEAGELYQAFLNIAEAAAD